MAAATVTKGDAKRLVTLEAKIERGMQTFVEIGEALQAIRDERLYRNTHDRFEDYCRDRWGIGRSYANKQILAASVVAELGTDGPTPRNEATARALVPFLADKNELIQAWREAREIADAESREPSAEDVIGTASWNAQRQQATGQQKKRRTGAKRVEKTQGARIIEAVVLVNEIRAKIDKIDLNIAAESAPDGLRAEHLEILREGDEVIRDLIVALDLDGHETIASIKRPRELRASQAMVLKEGTP